MPNNDTILVLVGKGKLEEELKTMVAELEISNKVIFPGYFSGNELYAWYYAANVFILPSRYEPFGAVVNEALIFVAPYLQVNILER
jgi:glycosyltransferase involved in cell wall biosynthesis